MSTGISIDINYCLSVGMQEHLKMGDPSKTVVYRMEETPPKRMNVACGRILSALPAKARILCLDPL
jgi:hypothetical protein